MTYAVVRVRGHSHMHPDIDTTLKMLRLEHVNHCVIVPETPQFKGMLQKVKDYVTWGPVSAEVLTDLLKARCKVEGDALVTDAYLKKNSGVDSVATLTKDLMNGKTTLAKVPKVKPVLRLNPPRKGHGTVKRAFTVGGSLGFRGDDINDLLRRMM